MMRMMLVLVLRISVQAGMCVYEYLPTYRPTYLGHKLGQETRPALSLEKG